MGQDRAGAAEEGIEVCIGGGGTRIKQIGAGPFSLSAGRRVVLLGASNLSRGISTAIETARLAWGAPLDVLAAFGHGRSYGQRGGLLWHQLPGIAECGLWQALAERPPAPTAALLTDVGNDLLAEVPVSQILAWVSTCVDHLLQVGAHVVLTALPLRSVSRLSPARFLFFRSVFFPWSRLPYRTLLEWARELDERVRTLARVRRLFLAEPRPQWYGLDPIHIRRSCYPAAWCAMMSPWQETTASSSALVRGSLGRWLSLKRLAPEKYWLFGREQRHAQPAGRLRDGTTLWFY